VAGLVRFRFGDGVCSYSVEGWTRRVGRGSGGGCWLASEGGVYHVSIVELRVN